MVTKMDRFQSGETRIWISFGVTGRIFVMDSMSSTVRARSSSASSASRRTLPGSASGQLAKAMGPFSPSASQSASQV